MKKIYLCVLVITYFMQASAVLADVSCNHPINMLGTWNMMCSDTTHYARVTHYACIFKIKIETTDPADNAKLVYHTAIPANSQDMIVWSASTFHKDPIISARIDDMTCYAQD